MRVLALVVMLATVAGPAHPQSEYGSAAYLRSVIDVGQSIWITGPDGAERLGRVTSITDSAIEMKMLVSDVSYRIEDVRLIEVPDPIINGLLVGALIGSLSAWDVERPRSTALVWTLAIGGLGAAGGGFGDFLRQGRKTIYKGSAIVSVAPVAVPRGVALTAAIH